MPTSSDAGIPVLTDVVADLDRCEPEPAAPDGAPAHAAPSEALVAELQTRLAAETFALTEDLMRSAFAEMEAHLFEQVSRRLRAKLPELIDSILRQQLDTEDETADQHGGT